jgi:hypothetical protein
MIAQVFDTTGETGEPTDEFRKFAEEAMAEGRKHDGVEASISLGDPATGRNLVINLFRDRAAMDAFQAYSNAKIAEVEKLNPGVKVATPDVYTEVIALL